MVAQVAEDDSDDDSDIAALFWYYMNFIKICLIIKPNYLNNL